MQHRIHIFGASGSGTTTLGRHLADAIGGVHLDTDEYYWLKTDPPFTTKRLPRDRVTMIEREIEGTSNWVLSGSLCSWGEPLVSRFTLVVFLHLDPQIRMNRILARERKRYGDRILPGGDMRDQHLEFMTWASSYDTGLAPLRSFDLHEKWMRMLDCPVLRLDSSKPVTELIDAILKQRRK